MAAPEPISRRPIPPLHRKAPPQAAQKRADQAAKARRFPSAASSMRSKASMARVVKNIMPLSIIAPWLTSMKSAIEARMGTAAPMPHGPSLRRARAGSSARVARVKRRTGTRAAQSS